MLLANEYPENPGYAHLEYYARDAQVYYNIGLAYEKAGDAENARKYYEMASAVEVKAADSMKRMFRKALEQRNDNLWANYYLGNL